MVEFYICGVDWQQEPFCGIRTYKSIEEIKEKSRCWEECGIVEVRIDHSGNIYHTWVEPQNFGSKFND